MKKVIYSLLAGVMMLASCSDFTDITQKGKNLLSSTDDIDLLFNTDEMDLRISDARNLIGNIYAYASVAAPLAQEAKSRNAILEGCLDSKDMLTRLEILSTSDASYSTPYSLIGKVANPALNQLETATGTEEKKNALKAEALTLRAFCHYIVLQKFAAPYTEANKEEPGIIIMTEDIDISVPQPKSTIEQCYQQCYDDICEAEKLNALPEKASSLCRFNKASMYAIKAYICLSWQKYDEAIAAADKALACNDQLYDYYGNKQTGYSYGGDPYDYSSVDCMSNPETYYACIDYIYYAWVNPELVKLMEPTYSAYFLYPKMGDMYKGISKVMPAYAVYEDYGALLGVPGWESGYDFSNYYNSSGLYSGEMYLIKAEAQIKNNDLAGAAKSLNTLRKSRIDPDTYADLSFSSKSEAITAFKADYIAENIWEWWDYVGMKRWNSYTDDAAWSMGDMKRTIGGVEYTLSPKSQLWVFPFPTSVTEKNANVTWNTMK